MLPVVVVRNDFPVHHQLGVVVCVEVRGDEGGCAHCDDFGEVHVDVAVALPKRLVPDPVCLLVRKAVEVAAGAPGADAQLPVNVGGTADVRRAAREGRGAS